MTKTHKDIPPQLLELAKANRKKLTHVDPGIAIAFNDQGLEAHHPNNNAAAARREIADAIQSVGMLAAYGGNSTDFFTGRAAEALAAQDAVHSLVWTHHDDQLPDIGEFYFVYPKGANTVEFAVSCHMFNAFLAKTIVKVESLKYIPMTKTNKDIPPQLLELAKANRKKLTHVDPGIAIAFNDQGLEAHHPNNNAAAARREIADAIQSVGMLAAYGGNSTEFFTGRAAEALAAQDAVHSLEWTHHDDQLPDIGEFYFVYPKGANTVEFTVSCHMFNAFLAKAVVKVESLKYIPMTKTNKDIPPQLLELAKANRKKLTHVNPGIAIAFNDQGLEAHHPNNNAAAARREIADVIQSVGMLAAYGGNSTEFFTGRAAEALAAQDAVHSLVWTHHDDELPDVGEFYFVYPKGANNVEFAVSCLMFNA